MDTIFIIPLIVFTLYAVVSCTNWFNKIDRKTIRRIYYLLCLVWSYFFITSYYDTILCVKINTTLDVNKSIINIVSCTLVLLVFFSIWDFLFISSKSISSFSLKELSITTEEFTEVAKATETKYEDFNILERIMEVQYKMMWEMYYYVSNLEDIDPNTLYKQILNKYVSYRKEIKINSFTYDSDGLSLMKNYFNLNDLDFSSIQHCLNLNRVCSTIAGNNRDRLFAIISTKFTPNDMIIIVSGHRIMRNEHFIIQNIISYFDTIIELDIKELNIEEMKVRISELQGI